MASDWLDGFQTQAASGPSIRMILMPLAGGGGPDPQRVILVAMS